ncbi:MAG: ABC transporter permease [Clostridia bacterium]|nr:ABC transporter permease [Clostridia bacterium]
MQVANRKCIRTLGLKSMRAARTRNLVAILAIALTTVLFTSLFTIALSINDSFQQANFRQAGGWNHGTFKYLTKTQFDELKDDPLIKQAALRRFVGMPKDAPFNKSHVEVGYSDPLQARWMYCDPVEGRLPAEGTDEAATDTRVLALLGVEPKLGAPFTMTFDVDGKPVTETFALCGWWDYDEAIVANHVLIPFSRAQAIYDKTGLGSGIGNDGMTGAWNLDVMFKNSLHTEQDMLTVLARHGYQSESRAAGDNYIPIGVNWGYTGAQLSDAMDAQTAIALFALLLLIIFTGYLIIYNVFQISVAGDIRFYGLLKTIGTTPGQLRRIIRQQALLLSLGGIPLGLLGGWLVGAGLTPVVLGRLNGVVLDVVSLNPLIFLLSSLFALFTVLLSCVRPGRIASRVSPIEAVRYTEGSGVKRKLKKSGRVSLPAMAWANLGRSRGKTAVTILSLSLAVVLLNMTVAFTNGFDMDKYLRNVVADYIVANAAYFQTGGELYSADTALPESVIQEVAARDGITDGGRVYGKTSYVSEFVAEDYFRAMYARWIDAQTLDRLVARNERDAKGLLSDNAQLYGMEPFALDKLSVLEGDLSKLYLPGGRYIAAVYSRDDYGNPYPDSHWAKAGDTITLRYVEEYEYYHPDTGEVYGAWENVPEDAPWVSRAVKYRDIDYTVAAEVLVPNSLSYRYYGSDEFILNDQTFIEDTRTDCVMLYAFDTSDQADAGMEAYLADYTSNINPQCDYESKATYAAEFESFRNMFLLLGGALCFIVGLVGVLNFFNAVLTGILTRKREFAMLQSIGMTGGQLKSMLVWEGLCYAMGAILLSLLLTVALGPLGASAMESMFWFFTYRFTITPILLLAPLFALLGCAVPLCVYRAMSRLTIVERLREAE